MEAAQLPYVGIVLVHYRDASQTLECVSSIRALLYPRYKLFLIDNCSADRSGAFLRSKLQESEEYIFVPKNEGFAAGANVGISQALAKGADYIFLVNPDLELRPETLGLLVERGESSPEVGVLGPKVLSPDDETGDFKIWGLGGRIDFAAQEMEMRHFGEPETTELKELECDYVPGCALLAKRGVVQEVGLLPEEYFMYFEESDWCTRVKRAGYRLLIVPGSIAVHLFEQEKMQSPFVVYYYNRNRRLFWFRHGKPAQRLALIVRTIFTDTPRAINAVIQAPDKRNRALFKAHLASCLDFLRGRTGER